MYADHIPHRIHLQATLERDQSSDPTCHFLSALFVDDSFVDTNLEAVTCKRLRDAFRLPRFVSVCRAPLCIGGHDRAVRHPFPFHSFTACCQPQSNGIVSRLLCLDKVVDRFRESMPPWFALIPLL